jgi:ketosteroid isomerase-like protein
MNTTLETAERALRLLAPGYETGNFGPYLEMLTDDFTFWTPTGAFRGKNVGKEAAARNYRFIAEAPNTKIHLSTPYSVTSGDSTVIFELEDGGTLLRHPFQNRVVFAMDVRGDQICGFREYVGDVDLELFSQISGQPQEKTPQGTP